MGQDQPPAPRPDNAHRDPRATLREADRLRDARDWPGAAAAYATWLAGRPHDWPTWIQYGHALKEAGDPEAALGAYRRAEQGRPGDADLQMQVGHALKLLGNLPEARLAYSRALDIEPANDAAWREVAHLLGQPDVAAAGAPEAQFSLVGDLCVVFDLTDLLSWFGTNRAPSGIQRVQLELVGPALRGGGPAARVILAAYDPATLGWRALPREAFNRLASLSRSGADPREPAWEQAVSVARQALDAAPELAFPEGAWLVVPGSSWWLANYHLALRLAKARFGLRYAPLVHDCGPLVVPEHSPPATVAQFARWFAGLAAHADLLLPVSAATAEDIRRLQAQHLPGIPLPPMMVVGLDGAPRDPAPRDMGTGTTPHAGVNALAGRPYALFLGTLESRKNHLFVLNAWLSLIRKHGAARLPLLVLAGRTGFMGEPVLALLRSAPALRDAVLLLPDVPDAALPLLYRRALFVLYNSDHEGWGLPVTEAIAQGRAVLAPDHSALPEAGRGAAILFRPHSEPDFIARVEQLAFDPAFRAAAEARAAAAPLRSWQAIGDAVLGRLLRENAAPRPQGLPPIPLGTIIRFGIGGPAAPSLAALLAEALRDGEGWHAPEHWGCWTRPLDSGGRAALRLALPPDMSGRIRLHLLLRAPATAQAIRLLPRGADPLAMTLAPGEEAIAALELPASGGVIDLALEAHAAPEVLPRDDGPGDGPPGREVGVGLVSLMACRADDLLARLDYLEHQRFTWPEVEA